MNHGFPIVLAAGLAFATGLSAQERSIDIWFGERPKEFKVCVTGPRSIDSPAYVPGPYSKIQESGVLQFVDWYCDTLAERLAPETLAAE